MERRLAAIFSADVQGYSRLMGDDEVATVQTLTEYRDVLTTLIETHRGRVVDAPGDNLLAEFASVVDAVESAVEIQRELAHRNAALPLHRQMHFRIGINLGDVLVDGDRIYGDGVNIAARMEGLSEGGGICIAGTAYDQVKNKLALGYTSLGEHTVKNITDPVRVYGVHLDGAPSASGELDTQRAERRRWRQVMMAVAIILLVGTGVIALRHVLQRPAPPPAEVASATTKMTLPLPTQPSVAVLPFDNLSGDPDQDYFSDGMTEDIITSLTKIANLFVIARNSTFTYKGKAVKVQRVGEELGVRYVLEGSIQKAGDRVRVTAQLVDAATGRHLWAERFDRGLRDVFDVQDAITRQIVEALEVKLTEGEQARVWHRATSNLKALEYYRRSREHYFRFTKEENVLARQLKEKAVALDPQFALGWSGLGWTHLNDARFGWGKSSDQSLQQASDLAHKALARDDAEPFAYLLLGQIAMMQRQYDQAVAYGEKAMAVAPGNAGVMGAFATTLSNVGRSEESVALMKRAMRLSPYYPAVWLRKLGRASLLAGRHEEALIAFQRLLERQELKSHAHMWLAIVYSELGQDEKAQAHVAALLTLRPMFSLERWTTLQRYRYKEPADLKRLVDALQTAGLQ